VGVLTGGPGTGKTTTAAALLALRRRLDPSLSSDRILVTAPTGKAACRIAEAITKSASLLQDLTEAEKTLLLERAARSLAASDGGKVYENLQSKLSYLLDQTVNNQVSKKLLEENLLETKTDLVLDTTSEGITTLLSKNPAQKYKLRVFLNQIIPQPIRFLAWQLFYSNSNCIL
jgi:ATP-dependent exoDNAse (exonuclease V) alpha subunit